MNQHKPNQMESLLKQMKLKTPSSQLDEAILGRALNENSEPHVILEPARTDAPRLFGWSAVLSIAGAAMLCGLILGQLLNLRPQLDLAVASGGLPVASSTISNSNMISAVGFNTNAFNLLHGHSQKPEFEDCEKCHQVSDEEDAALAHAFDDWFYGDQHFFEEHHVHGFGTCSDCHQQVEEDDLQKDEIEKDWHSKFSNLANCAKCHKTDADGFEGFEKNWHAEFGIEGNCSDCHQG